MAADRLTMADVRRVVKHLKANMQEVDYLPPARPVVICQFDWLPALEADQDLQQMLRGSAIAVVKTWRPGHTTPLSGQEMSEARTTLHRLNLTPYEGRNA